MSLMSAFTGSNINVKVFFMLQPSEPLFDKILLFSLKHIYLKYYNVHFRQFKIFDNVSKNADFNITGWQSSQWRSSEINCSALARKLKLDKLSVRS